MADLIFNYGTMGSSKTASLIIFAYNLETRDINFLCFKPDLDTRSGIDVIKSRIPGLERPSVTIYKDTDIYDAVENLQMRLDSDDRLQYILIDESQFLTTKQVDELVSIVDLLKINVYCYGLRTDFKTQLFEGTKRLFETADQLVEISTVCNCGEKAIFNARKNEDGSIIKDGNQILIGGDETYEPICRKCYFGNF